MDFTALISNAFGAIKEFFGFARQRDTEENSPAMQKALESKREAAATDKTRAALAQANLDQIRKDLAE